METRRRIFLSIRFIRSMVVLLGLFLGMTWTAQAQSTATLQGTVTDPSGNTVPGAKIKATNQATGMESTTTTDNAGNYLFPSLAIGLYKVEVTSSGFQSAVVNNLKLDVATTVTKNVQLTLGQMTQTVEVTGGAPLVDTTGTSLGQVINDKSVQDIPLNGRHFTDLSLLTPGTVTPPVNGFPR